MHYYKLTLLLSGALFLASGNASAIMVEAQLNSQIGSTQTTIYTITPEAGEILEAFIIEYDPSITGLVGDPTLNPMDWEIFADDPFFDPLDPFASPIPGAFSIASLMGPLSPPDSVTFTLSYDVTGVADFGTFFATNLAFDDFSAPAITPTVVVSPPTGTVPEPSVLALMAAAFAGFGFSRRGSRKNNNVASHEGASKS